MNKIFAYIRVSSKDQNVDRQLEEMKNLNINERDIFIDYQSGKDFKREKYQAMKYCLREGDLLYIKSIDRLGRNYKEILEEWNDISMNIKANIRVLDIPMLDTTQYKDLIGNFVANLTLQILSYVAEVERLNTRQRQAEGIAIAKKKGKKFGRPPIQIPQQFPYYYNEWKKGNLLAKDVMNILNLKRTTFYKLVKQYEEKGIQLTI